MIELKLRELMYRKTCPPSEELEDLCQWSHFLVSEENNDDFVSFVLSKFDELGKEGCFSESRFLGEHFQNNDSSTSERTDIQSHQYTQRTVHTVTSDAPRKISLGNAGEILLYLILVHFDNLTFKNRYARGVNVTSGSRRISLPGIDILVCIFNEKERSEDHLFIYEVKTIGEPNGDIPLSSVCKFFRELRAC